MDKKICPYCSAENDIDCKYCVNCGHTFEVKEIKAEKEDISNGVNTESGRTENRLFGIEYVDLVAFIGRKSGEIIPKFQTIERTGSKITWCWPAAVLGFFLGPIGCAIWFFYRKMTKPATVLTLIGLFCSLLTLFSAFSNGGSYFFKNLSNYLIYNEKEYFDAAMSVEPVRAVIADALTAVSGIISDFAWIFSGLFGYWLYKEHTVSKIKNFQVTNTDPRYYKFALSSMGGVSGGFVALGIAILILAKSIVSFLSILPSFYG